MTNAVVVFATAWGSKHGGINSFSTQLCKALAAIVRDCEIYCVSITATPEDIANAKASKVTLKQLDYSKYSLQASDTEALIASVLANETINILWWVGHDYITGPLAVECKKLRGGKSALFMHMSPDDYAYVKHGYGEAVEVSDKIELQKEIFRNADKAIAVGPLLMERLMEITKGAVESVMVVPGLSEFIDQQSRKDRVSAISFGRFDEKEQLTKQGLLSVASFAHAVKLSKATYNKALEDADMTIIGASENIALQARELAEKTASRVINLKTFPFIEDQTRLSSLLQDCNICLMLSWHEGFGLTAWEAISKSIPVIISKNSGVFRLLEIHGGAAMGCFHCVDIKGSSDGQPNPEDVISVSDEILKISGNLDRALSDARSLRNLLRNKGYNWDNCAKTVARHLNLQLLKVDDDSKENITNEATLSGLDISHANKLLEAAESFYKSGNYNSALDTLAELGKMDAIVKSNYPIAMDMIQIESEVRLRLNEYPIVSALTVKISSTAADKNDWPRYIKAKAIDNVALRDKGEYEAAIEIAKEIVLLSEKLKDKKLMESSYRKLSRSYSLGGNWQAGLSYAQMAENLARERGLVSGEATSSLAMAEAYRHGYDFTNAVEWYKKSRDLATTTGNVDCYLWATLGLADSHFLMDENPKEILMGIDNYIEKNNGIYHLESLHTKLSLYAVDVKFFKKETYPQPLVNAYNRLNIQWPALYVKEILAGDFSNPKKF